MTEREEMNIHRKRMLDSMLKSFGFEDIEYLIERLPLTWYPAVFVSLIEAMIKKKIFKKGGMERVFKEALRKTVIQRKKKNNAYD